MRGRSEVGLWVVDLDSFDGPRLEALLSDEERERAHAVASEGARDRFVVGRAVLRAILAEATGRAPAELRFLRRPHGKPALVDGDGLEFNVSHSRGLAVIALSGTGQVGADLERVRPRTRLDRVAGRYFSDGERATLEELDGDERLAFFYSTWTAKEAFVKATGRGLGTPAASFEVPPPPAGLDEPAPLSEAARPSPRFALRRLEPAPGFVAAVVAEGRDWQLRRRVLPERFASR